MPPDVPVPCLILCSGIPLPHHSPPQAAARGKKQGDVTEADPADPLASQYGDYEMVQSVSQSGKTWTDVAQLVPELDGKEVGEGVCRGLGAGGGHALLTETMGPHTQSAQRGVPAMPRRCW